MLNRMVETLCVAVFVTFETPKFEASLPMRESGDKPPPSPPAPAEASVAHCVLGCEALHNLRILNSKASSGRLLCTTAETQAQLKFMVPLVLE
jgi:hypothetical protein